MLDHYKEDAEFPVIIFQSAGKPDIPITYKELVEKSYCYAEKYFNDGIRPGDVIVLVLQHSLDLIYSYFGAILAGAVPSMMPFLTEKLIPEKYQNDFQSLLTIIHPKAIVTYREFKNEVFDHFDTASQVKHIILSDDIVFVKKKIPAEIPGIFCDDESVALLQHSSGTTGLQKGVALSHRAVFNQLDGYIKAIKLDPDKDVIVSWLPLYHDMGLIACFLMPVLYRTQVVMMSPFEWVRAPYRLLTAISDYKGTICWLPNFAFNFCAKKVRDSQLEDVNLSSMRALINCSEPMRDSSHQVFAERYVHYGFNVDAFATSYGMAENVFSATQGGIDSPIVKDIINRDIFQTEKKAVPATLDEPSIEMLSTGKAVGSVQIAILDEKDNTLSDREIGEVIIKSNCLFNGYYNRPDLTEKCFINGWFRTGDYGYMADGELYITGRKKDLIIVGGKNIYPQDLEALAMDVPGVHPGRAVAFGIFDEDSGTEEVVLIAEVDVDSEEEKSTISRAIKEKVTRNSAISLRHVMLVDEKWLIKTSSGKMARAANKERYIRLTTNSKTSI
ncbi:MAG: AMP-dependent synthetase and ligase [Anaerolinea thermophila]|uniref:AMP-dependent synthetase and ligase n=1 Tax=Anaerolinea thermophila TaxID=167964 RepID=A0A124FN58_9CHLR|nr:MAG: AMP-dependent synthetase and ligase [Anaerolinea thermophila]